MIRFFIHFERTLSKEKKRESKIIQSNALFQAKSRNVKAK